MGKDALTTGLYHPLLFIFSSSWPLTATLVQHTPNVTPVNHLYAVRRVGCYNFEPQDGKKAPPDERCTPNI